MPPFSGHPRNLDPTLVRVELALPAGWTLNRIEDELLSAGDLDEDFASAVWLYAWSRADGLGAQTCRPAAELHRFRRATARAVQREATYSSQGKQGPCRLRPATD
jgi:hypothetical protein